ncbi:hypothetical protein, partial [Brevibacillus parabrevis]|uniref:hypothetical protein n=1 Tax=Brevibacillus parabrevis TaxID=54914 RepID=UPI003D220CC0
FRHDRKNPVGRYILLKRTPYLLLYDKKLIPTHDSSWKELLKVNQVWLSNFLVFGLLVVLYDLVVRVVNVFTQNF